MEKVVVSREIWWQRPPNKGETDLDVQWGYLVFYSDNSHAFEFDENNQPPVTDILNRKSCRI